MRDLRRFGDARLVTTMARPKILTRPVLLLFAAAMGALASFYLLLSVVPLYVGSAVGAGLATGAMMLATVLVELVVPRLLARFGYRAVLAAGLVLLGAPAVLLPASSALAPVVAVSLARGAGLGIVVVAGIALAAELVPVRRRGEGLALYGVAVTIPAVAGLPLGVWLVEHAGFTVVFVAGAAVSLVVLPAVVGLPAKGGRVERPSGVLSGLSSGPVARPTVIFAAMTFAAGVVVTFLPLAVAAQLAAVALLVQSAVAPLARWLAGWFGDRHGAGRLLLPSVLCSGAGVAGLIWLDSPLATIAGMALFGIGFGAGQNVTLAMMFERDTDVGRVSALWNLAYDAGMGAGAVGFGLLVGPLGYPAGFGVTAALLLACLAVAARDRSRNTS